MTSYLLQRHMSASLSYSCVCAQNWLRLRPLWACPTRQSSLWPAECSQHTLLCFISVLFQHIFRTQTTVWCSAPVGSLRPFGSSSVASSYVLTSPRLGKHGQLWRTQTLLRFVIIYSCSRNLPAVCRLPTSCCGTCGATCGRFLSPLRSLRRKRNREKSFSLRRFSFTTS